MDIYRKLYQFVRPYRGTLVLAMALSVLFGLLEAALTSLSIPMFDDVLVKSQVSDFTSIQHFISIFLAIFPGNKITRLCVAILVLALLKGLSLYYANYFMNRVGQGVVTDLRNALFHHVLGQSMGFFSLNSTGRLMSRMSGDVEQVQESVSNVLADFVREVVTLLFLLCVTLWIDWRLACLSLLIAPFVLVLTLGMGKRIRRVSLRGREDAATLNDQLQQSITGMRIIKAFGMEAHEEDRFRHNSARLYRSNVKAAAILFLNSPVMEFIGFAVFIPFLYYASGRINTDKTLTFGLFGGSMFSLFRMYDPIRKLSRMHVQFQRAIASGARIVELLEEHREIQDRPGAKTLGGINESIEFRDVCFDYVDQSGETRVLKDINLKVERNQVVAIVGSSGSGKTTLAGLIPRFYDPTSGKVLIDGIDIREYTQNSLRKQIAMVTQETFLFNDTVRNNIGYGNILASEEEVVAASRVALADDFISRFPMKYATLIGERGQRLSGGERQRISIARALLRNAPILVLDEATSALDSESEKLVQQALTNLIRDRTTFVIAHRLSTIRNADMIVVIDKGRIVESGTHDVLIARDGHYRKFFRLQTEED